MIIIVGIWQTYVENNRMLSPKPRIIVMLNIAFAQTFALEILLQYMHFVLYVVALPDFEKISMPCLPQ